MDLDSFLEVIGAFGLYQKCLFLLASYAEITSKIV